MNRSILTAVVVVSMLGIAASASAGQKNRNRDQNNNQGGNVQKYDQNPNLQPGQGHGRQLSTNNSKGPFVKPRSVPAAGNAQTTQGNAQFMMKPGSNHPKRQQGNVGNSQNVYSENSASNIEKKADEVSKAIISKIP